MTKIPKGTITKLKGRVEDIYPNLVIIADKNIAVPIDKKSIVDGWALGDTVEITYDDGGYLLSGTVTEKGTGILPTSEPGKKEFIPVHKTEDPTWIDSSKDIAPGHAEPETNTAMDPVIKNVMQKEERKKGPVEECRMPTREELLAMVYDYNTYWKAKTLMDIQAHDEIRRQVNWKNWQECINSAIEAYKVIGFLEGSNHLKMIDELAEHFHTFIPDAIKDKDTLMKAGEQK